MNIFGKTGLASARKGIGAPNIVLVGIAASALYGLYSLYKKYGNRQNY